MEFIFSSCVLTGKTSGDEIIQLELSLFLSVFDSLTHYIDIANYFQALSKIIYCFFNNFSTLHVSFRYLPIANSNDAYLQCVGLLPRT